ncbi:MAG: cobalamin-binding protein [Gemmatimonadetes bacterium]|nr:cobalamin-binding protein [Gemmatimonadota bacterium]
MPDLNEIATAVIAGDAARVGSLVDAALGQGASASEVLEQGLTAGMAVVGRRFRANEVFVPEVLVAARAMKAGMVHLDPIFSAAGVAPVGTFVIGTVRGDIHDIGKNLVGMMLRGAGFNVVDLGVNVMPQVFVDAVQKHGAQLVGLSALLTTTMVQMKPTIDALRAAVPQVKILVGGAPVSPEYAASVGADGYGANATDAVERALEFMGRPASS